VAVGGGRDAGPLEVRCCRQTLGSPVPPGCDQRLAHRRSLGGWQPHGRTAAPPPTTCDWFECSRLGPHKELLLIRREHDDAPPASRVPERGEDLVRYPEVRMSHVRGFGRLRQTQGKATEFIGRHKLLLLVRRVRLPLPQPVSGRPRQSLARLASHHDDLTAVMRLVRHEVGEHMADVEGEVPPYVPP